MNQRNNYNQKNRKYAGQISGAYLLGLVGTFSEKLIINPEILPYNASELRPEQWYPYGYLVQTINIVENLLPNSTSLLFWAGIRFMEIWYWDGPGKDIISSSFDWVVANEHGQGYNSVAKGEPSEIGWTRNIETNIDEGYALVENVMPWGSEFLRGIYYGGFRLFDDLSYFNVEIISQSQEEYLPHQKTIIKLTFEPKQEKLSDEKLNDVLSGRDNLTQTQIKELLLRFKHMNNASHLRERYNQDMSNILSQSIDKLRKMKQDLVLLNQKLALEAASDPLTKLNNRRFFNLEIKRLWSIAKRCDFTICIIMIDIDFFKLFNDHYGHLEGDKAIVAVADCIKETFRRGEDIVARYGGEEFICVALNKTKSEISERAQELIIKLSEKKINHVKSQVSEYLTVSIGSATSKGKETETNELIALADQGLYEAKQRGRNCHVHINCTSSHQ